MKSATRILFLASLLTGPAVTLAQDNPPAAASPQAGGQKRVDDPSEMSKFKETCGSFEIKQAGGCTELLFTGQPVHIAVGSLSPQNGFGSGVAVASPIKPTETWRPSWNADAVATPNGSWRAGVYFKFVHTPQFKTTVHYGKPKIKSNLTELPEHTVLNVYAQAITLEKVTFFGLGPSSTLAGRSYFGMREVIPGVNVVKPIIGKWNVSLLGEMNGRFVDIRPSTGNSSPSIGVIYTEATAPGLSTQPGFLQLGEGIRMRPIFWSDLLHLNYAASYQQFIAAGNSTYSFQRFMLDLSHDFAIYKSTTRFYLPRDANGPDECSIDRVREFPACSLVKSVQVSNCEKENPQ